jgi:hypothetical protein
MEEVLSDSEARRTEDVNAQPIKEIEEKAPVLFVRYTTSQELRLKRGGFVVVSSFHICNRGYTPTPPPSKAVYEAPYGLFKSIQNCFSAT